MNYSSSKVFPALNRGQQGEQVMIFVLFLVWPFLAFLYAIKEFKRKEFRIIILLYFVLFGYSMNIPEDRFDGSKLIKRYEQNKNITWSQLQSRITSSLTLKSEGKLDFFAQLTDYIFSRFSDHTRWLFAFHALIFGFFSIRIFEDVYDTNHQPDGVNRNAFLFFLLLVFLNPISNVHAVRFPIASWAYVYCVYFYLKTEKDKYLFYAILTLFIHFGLIIGIILILIYRVIKNNNIVYFSLIILSYIYPKLLYNYLINFEPQGVGEGAYRSGIIYADQTYIEQRKISKAETNWYKRLSLPLIHYSTLFSFVIVSFFKKWAVKDKFSQNLISFLLLLFALINFGFEFDSVGRRYLLIWIVLVCILIYHIYQVNRVIKIQIPTLVILFPTLLWIVYKIRVALEIFNPIAVFGNPFLLPFSDYTGSFL